MFITINPINEKLKTLVKENGATGWVTLQNLNSCTQRAGNPATLVCKDNKLIWLIPSEIK
jgi:hypothetical protein